MYLTMQPYQIRLLMSRTATAQPARTPPRPPYPWGATRRTQSTGASGRPPNMGGLALVCAMITAIITSQHVPMKS
jgi:hypothetical protein